MPYSFPFAANPFPHPSLALRLYALAMFAAFFLGTAASAVYRAKKLESAKLRVGAMPVRAALWLAAGSVFSVLFWYRITVVEYGPPFNLPSGWTWLFMAASVVCLIAVFRVWADHQRSLTRSRHQ